MPGKLPIDRVREARQNAPKIFDEHRERFSERQAELRDADADDPVAGARPASATPEAAHEPEGDDA
jgi:predicted phage gp36 major capsid-like protein